MLEILLLYSLCKRIGQRAREKGRQAIGYQFLLILFWFGGEIGTAIIGAIVLALLYGEAFEDLLFAVYLAAIVGAAVGAWIAFRIVASLPLQTAEEPPNPFAPRD